METRQKKACPHCGKGKLTSRSRRPALMKATLFWLPIKRYSCNICDKKSYVYGSVWETAGKKNTD